MTYLHLVTAEWKKLWGSRMFCLLLVFLAVINAVMLCWEPVAVSAGTAIMCELLDQYDAAPEETEREVRARLAALDELDALARQADERGESYPLTVEQLAEYGRRAGYRKFIALVDREQSWRQTLNNVILNARKNHNNYIDSGVSKETFVVRYQVGVVTHYQNALQRGMEFPVREVRGYDHILNDHSSTVFILIALLAGAVLLLLPEKQGMLTLVRSTRNGRWQTIVVKLTVGALMSLVLTAAFSLIPVSIYAVRYGLSGRFLPLQCVFPAAPYYTTILGGCLLRLVVQATVGTVFVWCVLLLTVPLRHTVSALGAGGGIIAASYLIGLWGKTHPHNLFHLFNLMTVLDSSAHLSQWNAFHFGKWSVDYIVTLPIFLLAALLLLGGLIIWALLSLIHI